MGFLCAYVSLLAVLTHLSLKAQSCGAWGNSLSCLIHLVLKLFHFSSYPYRMICFARNSSKLQGLLQQLVWQLGLSGHPACRFSLSWWWGWGFSSMLWFPIISVAISCPADLHCFTGIDYDKLIWHLYLNRNRESQVAYES